MRKYGNFKQLDLQGLSLLDIEDGTGSTILMIMTFILHQTQDLIERNAVLRQIASHQHNSYFSLGYVLDVIHRKLLAAIKSVKRRNTDGAAGCPCRRCWMGWFNVTIVRNVFDDHITRAEDIDDFRVLAVELLTITHLYFCKWCITDSLTDEEAMLVTREIDKTFDIFTYFDWIRHEDQVECAGSGASR